ncbi:hypothetical protein M422DRAFT_198681 [Sphaerobolus stellatus SS14]|nr:hypothetical protein M422DRAFT_198681 [Sphaerobolus stellatus SS14]
MTASPHDFIVEKNEEETPQATLETAQASHLDSPHEAKEIYSEFQQTEEKGSTENEVVEISTDESYDPPPDGGLTAWLVVLSCFILNFNLLGISYAYGVYQAEYLLNQFPHASAELISFIGAICTTFTLVLGIPIGRMIELYGFRIVTIGGTVLLSIGLLTAGFCKTVPSLLVTQGIVAGIGAGAMFIPANTVPAQWFSTRRSLAIGIASAGSGVGGIFWAFVLRTIIGRLGYQWALWISAAIAAFLNFIALFFFKVRTNPRSVRQKSIWSGLKLFKDPKFVTLYCASALTVFGYLVPYFYVPTYAQTQLQASATTGAILAAIIDLGMAIGRVLLGLMADSRIGALNTLSGAMALSGIVHFTFWLPASNSLPLLYIFAFTYGFFGGGYIGLYPAVLVRLFDPNQLAIVTGVFFSSELPGELTGGPIAGAIYTLVKGDHWTPIILYSGLTLFVGSLFSVCTRFQSERRLIAGV